MKSRLLLAVFSLSCLIHAPAFGQSSREKWIKHLKLMTREDPKADILIETEGAKISAALKEGDAGLARAVMGASYLMLDNEGLFEMVANAVLYNSDAALEGLRALSERDRENVLDVLPDGAELTFYDSPKKKAKYLEIVRRYEQVFAEKAPQDGDRPAVIDDPDGYTNVRSRPDVTAKIVDVVRKGQRFLVIDTDEDWCKVETPSGEIGYMHKSRVRFIK